jgi:hypothetical protein
VTDAVPVDLPVAVRVLHNAMTRLRHSQGRPSEEGICHGTSYHHGSVSRVLVDAFCPDWPLFCWIVTYLQGDLRDLYPRTRQHQAVAAALDGWPGRAAVPRPEIGCG